MGHSENRSVLNCNCSWCMVEKLEEGKAAFHKAEVRQSAIWKQNHIRVGDAQHQSGILIIRKKLGVAITTVQAVSVHFHMKLLNSYTYKRFLNLNVNCSTNPKPEQQIIENPLHLSNSMVELNGCYLKL